jgi:hypothetical protein
MTTRKNTAAALAAALLVAASTPGQAQRGPGNFSPAQQPCGDYYGSEYSYACVNDVLGFSGFNKHSCAYRTGPPCPPAGVPAKRR